MTVGAWVRHWSLRFLAPDRAVQQRYEAFRIMLACDARSHELMAEFEELYHEGRREDRARIRGRYRQMAEAVECMVGALERMHPGRAAGLRQYFSKYDFYARLQLAPPERFLIPPYVVNHESVAEASLVGNKSYQLLRLRHEAGVRAPEGFTITATCGEWLIEYNQLRPAIDLLLSTLDVDNAKLLERTSLALTTLIRHMEIPSPVAEAIFAEYDRLAAQIGAPAPVAVRSSALHEDDEHSFAGQYHSVLGVVREGLLAAYLEVLASKYEPQALQYRIHTGLGDEETTMAVLVLAMVDARASGVLYSRDPVATEECSPLLVHSIRGLGLPLVGGETTPDVFEFAPDQAAPVRVAAGAQEYRLVLAGAEVRTEPVARLERENLSVSVAQAARLAQIGWTLERFFGAPQDIEWAEDRAGQLVFLQARPLHRAQTPAAADVRVPTGVRALLIGARCASAGTAHGVVHHHDPGEEEPLPEHAVVVSRYGAPSLVRHIGRIRAVVCEQGSVTGHLATVCRECGVPLLVGVNQARQLLPPGIEVTVDGRGGAVYPGRIDSLVAEELRELAEARSGYTRMLRSLLQHITPLHLVDPAAPEFLPQSCRSLHDIIRYCHETAMQTMFGLGDLGGASSGRCRKLTTDLPIDIYLLDVGGAFPDHDGKGEVEPAHLSAAPFLALWRGLCHPDNDWGHAHFDWQRFGDLSHGGGIVSGESRDFASYAVISPDYVNFNIRFGFHFTLVDCLCGSDQRTNYCRLRFAGGGGDYGGRSLRIRLLYRILVAMHFEVTVRGDLLDARLSGCPREELLAILEDIGHLLGMTKLLDMVLREDEIDLRVRRFLETAGARAYF